MTKTRALVRSATIASLLCSVAPGAIAELDIPALIDTPTNGQGTHNSQLQWRADPPTHYNILTTTNLRAAAWQVANAQPIASTNLIGAFGINVTSGLAFFRVRVDDKNGPTITDRYPSVGGAGVGRSGSIIVQVADDSGVSTSAYRLAINGETTVSNGSPGVTATETTFRYDPGTNRWGNYGHTASVTFVAGDLVGNTATSSWSFTLEVEPVVTNGLIHLPPPASGAANARATVLSAAARHGVKYSDDLTITAVETNRIVFGYSGGHGLYLGGILVSHDPARKFYRRITGISDDTGSHIVTVDTTNVALTEIVQNGSFSPEVLIPPAAMGPAPLWTAQLSYGIPFSYVSDFTVLPIEVDDSARVTPGKVSIDLSGNAQVSCVIHDWKVTTFDVAIASELATEVRAQVEFFRSLDRVGRTETLGSLPLGHALGFIGPVPVWVELQLAVDLGLTVGAEGAVAFESGIDAHADMDFRLFWNASGWDSDFKNSFDVAPVPLDIGFQLSAEAWLYVRPRITALLYTAAGVSADLRRGPSIEATWQAGDPFCDITLYDKWSADVGMTIVGVSDNDLPNLSLFEEKRTTARWQHPKPSEQSPVFMLHPLSISNRYGSTTRLSAYARGNPAPQYQWRHNGIPIPFATMPEFAFATTPYSVGKFDLIAFNKFGTALSSTATISIARGGVDGPSLIFSEYVEGSGFNKAFEIYNPTEKIAYLDSSDYVVEAYHNGETNPSLTIPLTGAIYPGCVHVVVNVHATNTLKSLSSQVSASAAFNGDDALVLKKGGALGTVLDSIGRVGEDPGAAWTNNGVSMADATLRRMPGIVDGDTNPYDAFDPSLEWDAYPVNSFDNIGSR